MVHLQEEVSTSSLVDGRLAYAVFLTKFKEIMSQCSIKTHETLAL